MRYCSLLEALIYSDRMRWFQTDGHNRPYHRFKSLSSTKVDYTRRRTASLAQLAIARGLHVPIYKGRIRTRQDYINALRSADNDPKTLCGLPPELRVMIYHELLIFAAAMEGAHPRILETCRQVYDEAIRVLQEGSLVHANVWDH